ncbi:MAG TPA: acyl-CoA dehydrogenase family protein [Myxococcota bacterium]|nr:acyl-CoA dehydrogenase family protein [Myxococcota bacterium]
MGNFYDDNDDLRFYIERALDWGPLVDLTEYKLDGAWRAPDAPADLASAVELYQDVLRLIGGFAADEVAPRAARIDREHPRLVDGEVEIPEVMRSIFDGLRDMQVYGMCLPRELGGLNLPFVLYLSTLEIIGRGDVSVVAHYGFHGGIAMSLLMYSAIEGSTTFDRDAMRIASTRFSDAIDEITRGDAWGSMDITEPDAGSDMAALRCTAEQDETGAWFVTGQKIFITSGHGKYHIVIARTEAAGDPDDPFAGLGGLSLFLVPAWRDEGGAKVRTTTLDTVESKLGHNGSATVAISFERSPATLIGKRGEGFKLMLMLMNNARVGVGFESLGLCEAALRSARAYAAERRSMGKTIDRHEMIADWLDEMQTDLQGIRALAFYGAWHEELAQKLKLRLQFFPPDAREEREAVEREQRHHARAARRVTPLIKYLASEKAVEMSRRCVQIHGGAGYIQEYGAEKLLRDAMVMPIYEGTSQIQSLMAMKDTLLDAIRRPQDFVRGAATARWKAVSAAGLERRVARLQILSYSTQQHLIARIAGRKVGELRQLPLTSWASVFSDWDPKRDFGAAMLHAERLIRILSDVAIAEVLLEQSERFPERAELLERWLERAEPRCRHLNDEITSTGERLLAALAAQAAGHEAAK